MCVECVCGWVECCRGLLVVMCVLLLLLAGSLYSESVNAFDPFMCVCVCVCVDYCFCTTLFVNVLLCLVRRMANARTRVRSCVRVCVCVSMRVRKMQIQCCAFVHHHCVGD